jgi:hypothetical protein
MKTKVKRYEDGGDVEYKPQPKYLSKDDLEAQRARIEEWSKKNPYGPSTSIETVSSDEKSDERKPQAKQSRTIGPKDVGAKPKEYQEPPKGSITKSSLRGSGGAGGSGGIPSDKMDKMKKMNYKAGGKVAGKLATRGYGCAKK